MRLRRPAHLAFFALLAACAGSSKSKGDPMVADTEASQSALSDGLKSDSESGDGGTEPSADGGAAETAAKDQALQGDEEGAQALLKRFVQPNADHVTLTRSLRPTTDDYKAMFDAATAAKVEASQAKDWDSKKAGREGDDGGPVIKPKPSQTEVKLWAASGADLATGKGNAKEFPAGYKKIAKHLAPTVLFYKFKFVESGKDHGTAYDGLAFVNGHWVIAPKPWRALEDGGDAPAKPKTKKKKKA
jgi:hypothetical protein